ncbi:hypothetical protein [Novosphingobium percolationis]|uniref:hypothetical protein n=1 Tax=Novosphingobium percolationis TaxID=2871811 RepID=UPI001CD6CD37|nr:hypothetical protein [Novosphingobium percolationis]
MTELIPNAHGDPEEPRSEAAVPSSHPLPYPAQFLILAHYVRPEWAAMLAALAFDGGAR